MANDNFIFNNKHSFYDMGLITEIKSFPLFAEPKVAYDDLPGTDGEMNFSLSNPKERLCFKPRIIEMECHFADSNEHTYSFLQKASELAGWLATGTPKALSFEDDSDTFYYAHAANLFNIERITDFSGTFPLVFKCDPFRYALPIVMLSDEGNGELTFSHFNNGYYTPVNINVYGTTSGGFSIYNSRFPDKILTVNHNGDEKTPVSIDTAKMTVTFNGISILHQCEGDFFELAPGDNTIVLSAPGSKISSDIYFYERYL